MNSFAPRKKSDTQEHYIFIKAVILFLTVYSIHFKFMPVTPRILVLTIVLLYTFLSKKKLPFKQNDIKWIGKCALVVGFTAFSMYLNHAKTTNAELPLSSAFNFMIFVGIFPVLITSYFKNELEFCKAMMLAGSVQSMVVLLSAMTPQMRLFLEDIQQIDFSRYSHRIVGLGIAGSGGSIYLFSSFFCISYYIVKNKSLSYFTLLCYWINFIAIALVGRTGFYAAFIMLVFTIAYVVKKAGGNILKLILGSLSIIIIFIVTYNSIISIYETDTAVLKYTYKRIWEIFEGSNSYTLEKLQHWDSNLPPLNFRMLTIGTGIIRGRSYDGIWISHDGGYAKRYMSIGLFMTIYSYAIFFNYLYKLLSHKTSKLSRGMLWAVIVLMLVIEYKEPFIYQLALPFIVLMIAKLEEIPDETKFTYKYGH